MPGRSRHRGEGNKWWSKGGGSGCGDLTVTWVLAAITAVLVVLRRVTR
jgi:hypothetical protein